MFQKSVIVCLFALVFLGFVFTSSSADTFSKEAAFLKKHVRTIILSEGKNGPSVLVVPAYQGRVMTSAVSQNGLSYGWVNDKFIAAGKMVAHMNAFGGEDRFWIGPEGGQYALFFPPKSPFDMKHWQTPAPYDSQPFQVVSVSKRQASFRKDFKLKNYAGTKFSVRVDRQVKLLSPGQIWGDLHISPGSGVKMVGYETINRLTNIGAKKWTKRGGLLSIWILGQFNASPASTVVVPYKEGPVSKLGKIVTADYFGKIPSDRLQVKNGEIYFRADDNFRSKIGVSPRRAKGVLGSYDSKNKTLSIVQFNMPEGVTDYVNSLWKIQKDPFGGDVENSYNDGPNEMGTRMGNFYEVESSSPALALASGQSRMHMHRTIHITGRVKELDRIAKAVLGVHLKQIETGLPPLKK
jgi:hypothetical protein